MYVMHIDSERRVIVADKKQQRKRREHAYKLRALGVLLEIAESNDLIIKQLGGVTETRAFDLNGGLGTGFIIYLSIIIDVSKYAISRFALQLPWGDTSFRWLDDPVEIGAPWNVYRFPGTDALEFPRGVVMNHVAGLSRMWSRGEFVKGLLLGIGSNSIPDNFRHGSEIPAFIVVEDQFETPSLSPISLWTDRSAKFSTPLRNKPRRRLFEHANVEIHSTGE